MTQKKETDVMAFENNKVETVAPPKDVSIEQILYVAVQNRDGVNADTLEKLVELKERIEAKEAEKEFNQAMAKFQNECPIIEKKTTAKDERSGKEYFRYAALEDIIDAIKEPLASNGLSYKFDSQLIEGKRIRVDCTVTHEMGHRVTSTFESEIDGTARMNAIQKNGSTITYGRRFSLMMALGLIAKGEDDDGMSAGSIEVQLTEKQQKELEESVAGFPDLLKKLKRAYNISDLKYLPVEKYDECVSRINTYIDSKIAESDKKK